MTASKRYVPVSLVCLLIASTSAAMAGPSSMLDPYANVQAPTAKDVEAKNNKARAKKGLPPIHASQSNSSTKVEDATTSPTTYVTAPGGGNGKVVKHTEVAEAKEESSHGSGKIFGIGMPKVSLPKVSLSKVGIPGFGKKGEKSEKAEKSEPEVKIAKAPKVKVHKQKHKAAKEAPVQEIAQKKEADIAPQESKETPVGETPVAETPAVQSKDKKIASTTGEKGNVVSHTLKSATNGMVSGSKKVGSSIAGGAKASGEFLAKGVSKVGNTFKGSGKKDKDNDKEAGEGMSTKLVHLPSMFKKGHHKVAGLPSAFPKQSQDQNGDSAAKKLAAAKAPDLAQIKNSRKSKVAARPAALSQPSELVSEKGVANTAISNAPLGPNDELMPESQMKKSKGGHSHFSLFNPFSKKVAGKKSNQTL